MFSARILEPRPFVKGRSGTTVRPVPRQFEWVRESPVRARAMVLTPETVFFAGQPNLGNSSDEAFASYQGEKGARLVAVAVEDGAVRSQADLPAAPVLDGMAAAGNRLYLSLLDGTVICLEDETE